MSISPEGISTIKHPVICLPDASPIERAQFAARNYSKESTKTDALSSYSSYVADDQTSCPLIFRPLEELLSCIGKMSDIICEKNDGNRLHYSRIKMTEDEIQNFVDAQIVNIIDPDYKKTTINLLRPWSPWIILEAFKVTNESPDNSITEEDLNLISPSTAGELRTKKRLINHFHDIHEIISNMYDCDKWEENTQLTTSIHKFDEIWWQVFQVHKRKSSLQTIMAKTGEIFTQMGRLQSDLASGRVQPNEYNSPMAQGLIGGIQLATQMLQGINTASNDQSRSNSSPNFPDETCSIQ